MNNGHLFPQQRGTEYVECSATVRDYFAAHAPTDIPDWFKPTLPHPAVVMPSWWAFANTDPDYLALPTEQQNCIRYWMHDGCFDLESPLATVAEKLKRQVNEQRAKCEAMAAENAAARYIAWRWHYADLMLARRFA